MSFENVKKADKYAKDIISGKIPACRFVVKACERYIKDLSQQNNKEFPYKFDKQKAENACKFIQYLPHTKGSGR
ncbi:hypothetical protein [Phocoenobacter uteri]|uniref:hypothetical protein n=1 Tax=Phocoenobacter uteri TaxID=146806 RepID=UPI002441D076|nr:hypothetical protein [Phocoenobacter uteri]